MSRLERFLDALRARGLFAALIHRRENIRYLTGYTGEGCLFVSENVRAILTDFRYVEQAGLQAPGFECVRTRMGKSVEALVAELFRRSDADKLAVETNVLSYDDHQALSRELGGDDRLAPLARIPEELRAVKDENEVASILKAASIACRAFSNILGRIRVGMTEMDVKIALNYEMLALGSEGEAFDTIACAGENGSLPHAVAGRRVLKSGELLTLDFGATVDGYRSDMTRTVGIGHIGKDLRALYEAVLEAQLLALPAVKPGAVCEDVDRIARDFLEARYPGAFGHALGHGVGLFIHEQPRLGAGDRTALRPGHVVTVEPGAYIPGLGGCRIEDMAILTPDGFINPIDAPKQLIEL
ncbi:MAG: aminopeptidase P family protein [Clostridiales bacterium]|nr:aminopeptidase P family protein [Clostridiales bacterium]OPZ69586.1 MAG: putative peptidase [Firmicutes bacterium ADurb.Bin467]